MPKNQNVRPTSEIFVTKPFLPPLEDFLPYLSEIWHSRILTNGGRFHQQLEEELCEFLNVEHISLVNNGTIGLIVALQTLRITGEVITTPYSFVATSHALLWNGIKPIFVDIDPKTLNIDPTKIEAAITPRTTAILAVHCYGRPCDVEAIQRVADNYNLKVNYDAAHAFGVKCHCDSLFNHGDLSVLSFHATKVFNTFEGGAIVSKDRKTKQRIDHLKNFGIADEVTVVGPGINGKMSEVSAAIGVLQLKTIAQSIKARKAIWQNYIIRLGDVKGVECVTDDLGIGNNFGYFPILITNEYPESRDALFVRLRDQGIYTRRYFFPLISEMSMYRGYDSASTSNLPFAKVTAERILCLPIYDGLETKDQERVCNAIENVEYR